MATYKSTPRTINAPIEQVYDNISNLQRMQEYLDRLPADQLAKIGEVKFTADAIIINAPAVGNLSLNVIERNAPSSVRMAAANAPVKMEVAINLTPGDAPETTTLITALDVDIPMMLKAMIGPKMQEAADRLADMIVSLLNK